MIGVYSLKPFLGQGLRGGLAGQAGQLAVEGAGQVVVS